MSSASSAFVKSLLLWTVTPALVVIAGLLAGCANPGLGTSVTACSNSCVKEPEAPIALHPGPLAPTAEQQRMIRELQHEDVNVFLVGSTVTLVLPSDKLFIGGSANFQSIYADNVLQQVAKLLATYTKENVQVKAYTDNKNDFRVSMGLSNAQAQAVVNALWSYGSRARLMSALGQGMTQNVASNDLAWGREQNNRVVITFMFYPKVTNV